MTTPCRSCFDVPRDCEHCKPGEDYEKSYRAIESLIDEDRRREKMSSRDSPCRDCSERFSGCHAECKSYRAWARNRAEQMRKYRAGTSADEVLGNGMQRRKKRWNYYTK